MMYARSHYWSRGHLRVVTRTDWHETTEDADAALIRLLHQEGYRRPRWWQWWRWGEKPLTVWGDA